LELKSLDRSVVILAGGSSKGFSGDKGVLDLAGKPLLRHVVDAVKGLADEVIVVTSTQERADVYAKLVPPNVRFVTDAEESSGPLVAALTGFEAAQGEYSLLLPYDSPFVNIDVATLLFECSGGKSAVVPRWTNSQIDPLHAVYNTKKGLEAARRALAEGEMDLAVMVCGMHGVRYMSTLVLEQIDPDLKTFFCVNTPLDLKKANAMLKPRKTSKQPKPRLKKM
jgi:molybdenum cofactor guanylyltransferase